MSIDTRLRESGEKVREARHLARFTRKAPGGRKAFHGPSIALGAALAVLILGVPLILFTGSPVAAPVPTIPSASDPLAPPYPDYVFDPLSAYEKSFLVTVPEEQRVFFEDQYVSSAEVEAAFDLATECVREARPGSEVLASLGAGGIPVVDIEPEAPDDTGLIADCLEMYFEGTRRIHEWSHASPWADHMDPELGARIAICVLVFQYDQGEIRTWDSALANLDPDYRGGDRLGCSYDVMVRQPAGVIRTMSSLLDSADIEGQLFASGAMTVSEKPARGAHLIVFARPQTGGLDDLLIPVARASSDHLGSFRLVISDQHDLRQYAPPGSEFNSEITYITSTFEGRGSVGLNAAYRVDEETGDVFWGQMAWDGTGWDGVDPIWLDLDLTQYRGPWHERYEVPLLFLSIVVIALLLHLYQRLNRPVPAQRRPPRRRPTPRA
jgi:hypothetical protein